MFQPARLTPLVGDYIFAFGAFLDERFRDFDYYAGVYDAIYGLAEFYCYGAGKFTEECLGKAFEQVYLSLCPECALRSATANTVVRSFSRDEFEGDDIYWQLSLRDLPGIAYWGLQTR